MLFIANAEFVEDFVVVVSKQDDLCAESTADSPGTFSAIITFSLLLSFLLFFRLPSSDLAVWKLWFKIRLVKNAIMLLVKKSIQHNAVGAVLRNLSLIWTCCHKKCPSNATFSPNIFACPHINQAFSLCSIILINLSVLTLCYHCSNVLPQPTCIKDIAGVNEVTPPKYALG